MEAVTDNSGEVIEEIIEETIDDEVVEYKNETVVSNEIYFKEEEELSVEEQEVTE